MVNKLLDVDKEARQMMDEAQQYYDRTLLDLKEEKKTLLDSYTEKAARHLAELEAQQASEIDDAVNQLHDQTSTLLMAMEDRYNQHHQQWVEELTQKCIGR